MKKVSSFFITENAVSERSEKRQLISENFCETKILVFRNSGGIFDAVSKRPYIFSASWRNEKGQFDKRVFVCPK